MRMFELEEQGIVKRIPAPERQPAEFLKPFAGILANAPNWDSTDIQDDS